MHVCIDNHDSTTSSIKHNTQVVDQRVYPLRGGLQKPAYTAVSPLQGEAADGGETQEDMNERDEVWGPTHT